MTKMLLDRIFLIPQSQLYIYRSSLQPPHGLNIHFTSLDQFPVRTMLSELNKVGFILCSYQILLVNSVVAFCCKGGLKIRIRIFSRLDFDLMVPQLSVPFHEKPFRWILQVPWGENSNLRDFESSLQAPFLH